MSFRLATICILTGALFAPHFSVASDESFDQYASGALTVYKQFKEPSKEESEQFLAFIKNKWSNETCVNCHDDGINAGMEYAYRMKVPLDDNELR